MKLVLGHGICERRPGGEFHRPAPRLSIEFAGRNDLVEKAPALTLVRAHAAAVEQQL
jgi:hypothetical protein